MQRVPRGQQREASGRPVPMWDRPQWEVALRARSEAVLVRELVPRLTISHGHLPDIARIWSVIATPFVGGEGGREWGVPESTKSPPAVGTKAAADGPEREGTKWLVGGVAAATLVFGLVGLTGNSLGRAIRTDPNGFKLGLLLVLLSVAVGVLGYAFCSRDLHRRCHLRGPRSLRDRDVHARHGSRNGYEQPGTAGCPLESGEI